MIFSSHGVQLVLRRLLSIQSAIVVIWILTILWGERWVFNSSLRECEWYNWEKWPSEAKPHHVVLVADPQLVDPHTYPGRPWPLSTLTILYTDLYLKRSYRLLKEHLEPDSLFFLGDLFDGGREWGRPPTAEKRYKKYGNKYWRKEYARFAKIFLRSWKSENSGGAADPRGKKLVASLPGNHDLGFATGISALVKERFDGYFGPLNRADIVGNHTFFSLDTVSLSALDQPDSATGASGAGDGTASSTANSAIWKPAHEFLEAGREIKRRAIQQEVGQVNFETDQHYFQQGLSSFDPSVTAIDQSRKILRKSDQLVPSTALYPTILLTHVPLYRNRDIDCGPLRERGKSISISAGFQYQNVLTPKISQDIIAKLGAEEVAHVYSGDDHDYCEIEHSEFTGRIKEITVKSMSWAMGVRRPGFLAVSLWNPVDLRKTHNDAGEAMPKDTIQNRLCLLPDQLSIFIRYAQLLGVTLISLIISTFLARARKSRSTKAEPLLPLSDHARGASHSSQSSAFSTSPNSNDAYLSTRTTVRHISQPESPSLLGGYGNIPITSRSTSPAKGGMMPPPSQKQYGAASANDFDSDDWGMPFRRLSVKPRRETFLRSLAKSLRETAALVLLFYFWVLWYG